MALPVEVLEGKPINPAAEAGFANPLEWFCCTISLPFIKGINIIYVHTAFREVKRDMVTLQLPARGIRLRAVNGTSLAEHIRSIYEEERSNATCKPPIVGWETAVEERVLAVSFPPWKWIERPDLLERPKP